MDGQHFSEMNEISLSSSNYIQDEQFTPSLRLRMQQSSRPQGSDGISGFASIAHLDGTITVWDLSMRQCMANQKMHQAEVRGISYSADGRFVASAGFDKNIVISDTLDLDNLSVVKALEHDDKVVSVRWHPILPLLLSTSADKSARIWSPKAPFAN